jgi:molecular chaperone HscB
VHPDRYAGGSDAERRLALHLAANGNEAYRVLSDPTSRAAYLCEINGAPIDAERNTTMPTDFLIRQLEWREAIDEVREQAQREPVLELAARLAEERNQTLARVRELIDDRQDFAAAAALVRQLMFYDKLQSEQRQVLRRRA